MNLFAYKLTVVLLLMLGCGTQLIAMHNDHPVASSEARQAMVAISRPVLSQLSDISQIPDWCQPYYLRGNAILSLGYFSVKNIDGRFFGQIAIQWPLLKILDLSNNLLCRLSDEIRLLVNVQELWLSNNEFKELPAAIGELRELRVLGLYDNKLSHLPLEALAKLTKLCALDLQKNPVVRRRDWPQIRAQLLMQHPEIAIVDAPL